LELVKEYDYPVCFNFPVGHINDNRAMILGKNVSLQVKDLNVELKFL
jgi:muramoyltetrapeptide carboxypeptidase